MPTIYMLLIVVVCEVIKDWYATPETAGPNCKIARIRNLRNRINEVMKYLVGDDKTLCCEFNGLRNIKVNVCDAWDQIPPVLQCMIAEHPEMLRVWVSETVENALDRIKDEQARRRPIYCQVCEGEILGIVRYRLNDNEPLCEDCADNAPDHAVVTDCHRVRVN